MELKEFEMANDSRARPPQRNGFQHLAIGCTVRLVDAGAVTSVGSKGDEYNTALAETASGLCKTDLIGSQGLWTTAEDVACAIAARWLGGPSTNSTRPAATSLRQSSRPPAITGYRRARPA